jgi:pteridine reductase
MRPTALVTGATRRVGRAITLELARAGHDIVATWCTDASGAESLASDVRAVGATCLALRLDLGSDAVDAIADTLDGVRAIDALVLNAAAWQASPWDAPMAQAAIEAFRVNALGPVRLVQALTPLLRASTAAGGASVVAVGDAHAQGTPVCGYGAYMMSKAALHQAVQQMAAELAPAVRVNGVLPGVVAWPEAMPPERREALRARLPLQRAGTPDDVARLVRFLCTEATFVTGALIPVDGGRSIR